MRTTIVVDDELGERFREEARARGKSLSAFLVEAGRLALNEPEKQAAPFELITFGAHGAYPGVNLDQVSSLLVAEDQENYGSSHETL